MVELKTREIAAREHENRSVVDNAVVGIVVVDEQGGILTANKAVEAVFGYTTDELERKPLSLILGSEHAVLESAPLHDFGPRPKEPELRREPVKSFTRDRNELFLDVQLNSWMTESGEFRYTAIIRDVTDQQQAVMALEQTERRWNYALKGSDIGVFDIDLLSGGSVVSATWKTMLGFDADESIDAQKEWLARIRPEDMRAVMEGDRACQAGEIPRSIAEYRIRRKDGSWIWMRSDAVVVERDETGKATRLIGTQTDVTELRYAEAALRASEEQFRAAIEHAPIGMALITLDRNWIKVNQALCTLLGYTEDELLKLDRKKLIHPDERDSDRELSAKLIAGEIPSYQIEKRYFHSDGHILWVQLSVSIAHDVDTDSDYFIAQMQDITDQKEIERLKSEFVATVSHELRTPLTSIRGSLGLVLGAMAKDIPENANRLLTIAHSNCERLVLLINDILDLEKISSGKMRFDAKKERIADIVEQALEATQGYANEHAVEQTLSGTIPDCYAEVDQTRLHQVLANLLSNAAKFSPKGGTVTVSAEDVEDRIRINVADKGPGISPEFRSRIFGRFSQADGSASRAKSGTGLGLHISRMIMEQMGGTIGFDSVLGEGTTFWIELPLLTEDRSFSDGAAAYKLDSKLPSILHVEDDADFCEVVAAYFQNKAQVMSAATINGARTWLDTVSFDLVIIDVGLYNGNGLELLEDTAGKGIPAIVLSAQEDLENDPRVKRFYSKSKVGEAHLVKSVMKILEKSRGSKTIELRKSA
jgi:PAS domain S-box-containing protein